MTSKDTIPVTERDIKIAQIISACNNELDRLLMGRHRVHDSTVFSLITNVVVSLEGLAHFVREGISFDSDDAGGQTDENKDSNR